jgi:hypothetical protein
MNCRPSVWNPPLMRYSAPIAAQSANSRLARIFQEGLPVDDAEVARHKQIPGEGVGEPDGEINRLGAGPQGFELGDRNREFLKRGRIDVDVHLPVRRRVVKSQEQEQTDGNQTLQIFHAIRPFPSDLLHRIISDEWNRIPTPMLPSPIQAGRGGKGLAFWIAFRADSSK